MDGILSSVWRQFAFCHLDNIAFLPDLPVHYIYQVGHLSWLLYKTGSTFKQKKYKFFAKTIYYLSQGIRLGRFELTGRMTEAVAILKTHMTKMKLPSFYGLYNVFKRLLPNVSRIAAPLSKMLRKEPPELFASLNGRENAAVASLEEALISSQASALPKKELFTFARPYFRLLIRRFTER